ncbi:MAG: hypothetical protein L6V93_14325 [Clostridiales bacterium]|nr:MAG: hypothetical protein L6V93_14325 [Clostridiales bacterium]
MKNQKSNVCKRRADTGCGKHTGKKSSAPALKIPLTYILGEEGMGLFPHHTQYTASFFIIATAGLPVAVSKNGVRKPNARQIKRG